jgi:hypothetical protein
LLLARLSCTFVSCHYLFHRIVPKYPYWLSRTTMVAIMEVGSVVHGYYRYTDIVFEW